MWLKYLKTKRMTKIIQVNKTQYEYSRQSVRKKKHEGSELYVTLALTLLLF